MSTLFLMVTGAAWLAGALVPAWFLAHVQLPSSPSILRLVPVGAALAVMASVIGGAGGPGTPTEATGGAWNSDHPVQEPVDWVARLLLGAQSMIAVSVVAGVVLASRRQHGRLDAAGRSLAAFGVALAVERVVHVLPADVWRETTESVGGYRPAASVFAVNLPLLAMAVNTGTFAYLLAVRPRLTRLPSGSIAIHAASSDDLVRRLRTWVGDPTLGLSRDLQAPPAAGRTVVTVAGRPVAALEHDPVLADVPEYLAFAAAIAGSTLDAEASAAAAEGHAADAARAAARLLVADEVARRSLSNELRHGVLADLRRTAAALRSGGDVGVAADVVAVATAAIRALSHGVFPAELRDGGLAGVFDGGRGSPRERLDAVVEMTAYLAARDDASATFVAEEGVLAVRRTKPIDDADLVDRVTALGGTVEQVAGETFVYIPCRVGP